MWLPDSVYKRLPQVWFLMGLLFVAYAFYLGLDIPISIAYIVIGVACCMFGVGVAVVRGKNRRDHSHDGNSGVPPK